MVSWIWSLLGPSRHRDFFGLRIVTGRVLLLLLVSLPKRVPNREVFFLPVLHSLKRT